jgi:hypothetical protein
MRGARITVRCECGDIRYAEYGENWQCGCGRRWNTGQIPADEYWGMMREMRAERFRIMALAVVFAAAFGLLTMAVGRRAFAAAPVAVGLWLLVVMPRWRRRLRGKARSVPKWNLTPE